VRGTTEEHLLNVGHPTHDLFKGVLLWVGAATLNTYRNIFLTS